MKAIWEDTILAESDETIVIEGNHYFPPDSIKTRILRAERHPQHLSLERHRQLLSRQESAIRSTQMPRGIIRNRRKPPNSIKDYVAFWRGVKVSE